MQRRNFFRVKTSEKKYRRNDNVDDSFFIIYKAPMEYYLAFCNYLTTASTLVVGAFVVFKYINRFEEVSSEPKAFELTGGFISLSDDDIKYFAISLLVFSLAIRMIQYKYPLRIYRNRVSQ